MESTKARAGSVTFGLIGFLFLVELVSGILQGYYVPLISDLVKYLHLKSDADYNWFDAAQLLVSALVVPVLAKLGDMFGHKRVLLFATVVTALASWALAFSGNFTTYLVSFALQGFYVVWLPLEIALIFDRGRRTGRGPSQTRRAAGFLVVALEAGAIIGALLSGSVLGWFGHNVTLTLMIPAIAVTLVFFAILFGVPESTPVPGRKLDTGGFVILTIALLLITAGLAFLRLNGPGAWWCYLLIVIAVLAFVPFVRYERRQADPAIDLRVLMQPNMWPVQLTAGLIGISLLGAQAPLSTYAGTNPDNGYGLGLASGARSIIIGVYLISMIIGAVLFPILSRRLSPRVTMIIAAFLVAIGYLLFIPFHLTTVEVIINMVVAGLGSGALVGALPAAAAAAAPRAQTGIAAALTNTTKTIGGSFASAVFGLALGMGTVAVASSTAGSLSGYYTVWIICGAGAFVAAVLLFFVPKLAFADPDSAEVAAAESTIE